MKLEKMLENVGKMPGNRYGYSFKQNSRGAYSEHALAGGLFGVITGLAAIAAAYVLVNVKNIPTNLSSWYSQTNMPLPILFGLGALGAAGYLTILYAAHKNANKFTEET